MISLCMGIHLLMGNYYMMMKWVILSPIKIEGMPIFTVIQQVIRVNYQNTLLLTVLLPTPREELMILKNPYHQFHPYLVNLI